LAVLLRAEQGRLLEKSLQRRGRVRGHVCVSTAAVSSCSGGLHLRGQASLSGVFSMLVLGNRCRATVKGRHTAKQRRDMAYLVEREQRDEGEVANDADGDYWSRCRMWYQEPPDARESSESATQEADQQSHVCLKEILFKPVSHHKVQVGSVGEMSLDREGFPKRILRRMSVEVRDCEAGC
jgi:hypothetical protein